MALLKGLIPVLVTPMTEEHEPDVLGIGRLIDFLCKRQIGGLWALGSASEDTNMTFAQKIKTAQAVVEHLDGRAPVVMGTGLGTIDDNLRFFDEMDGYPVHGFHLLALDLKAGDARVEHYFTTLAERSPAPIWIYHNTKRARPVTGELLKTLSQHPNIGGIKVGGYSLSEMSEAIMLRSPAFDVIGAGGGQLLSMLCLGAHAHTTSEGSCMPELFLPLFDAFKKGDLEKARQIQFDIIAFSKSLPRTENGEHAAEEKFILSQRGVCAEHVNKLYRTLSSHEKKRILGELAKIGFSLQNGVWRHWTGRNLENVA